MKKLTILAVAAVAAMAPATASAADYKFENHGPSIGGAGLLEGVGGDPTALFAGDLSGVEATGTARHRVENRESDNRFREELKVTTSELNQVQDGASVAYWSLSGLISGLGGGNLAPLAEGEISGDTAKLDYKAENRPQLAVSHCGDLIAGVPLSDQFGDIALATVSPTGDVAEGVFAGLFTGLNNVLNPQDPICDNGPEPILAP